MSQYAALLLLQVLVTTNSTITFEGSWVVLLAIESSQLFFRSCVAPVPTLLHCLH